MKRMLSICLILLANAVAFAQLPLKGSWTMEQSMMGISSKETLRFDADQEGTLTSSGYISIAFSSMGVKINCTLKSFNKGQFALKGGDMVVDWEPGAFKVEMIKPLSVTVKGERDEGIQQKVQAEFDRIMEMAKNEVSGRKTYTNVQIKGDKLQYVAKDAKGKTSTKKYIKN